MAKKVRTTIVIPRTAFVNEQSKKSGVQLEPETRKDSCPGGFFTTI